MTTRTKAPPRRRYKLDGAKLGGETTWYESRTLAQTAVRKELEHWIKFAERYERESLPGLVAVRDAVMSSFGPTEWTFHVSGMLGRVALVTRKAES